MGTLRPFTEADIDGVGELHRAVLRPRADPGPELRAAYRRWLGQVFLDPPCRVEGVESIVHEEPGGEITGFLGVVARRMTMGGKRYVAAVTSQTVVDERGRDDLAGVKLLQRLFAGPQDLTVADEADNGARSMWEALGGRTAPLHSLGWLRPVRPCSLVASYLARRRGFGPAARAAAPLARAADALAMRLPARALLPDRPALREEVMTPEALIESLPGLVGRTTLRPEYDLRSLRWALDRLRALDRPGAAGDAGRLTRVPAGSKGSPGAAGVVTDAVLLFDGRTLPVGAYVYSMHPDGLLRVPYLAAAPKAASAALQHLVHTAVQRGAVAAEGRLDLRLLPALSENHAVFHRRRPWFLFHTKEPALASSFERGDAFFSPLDGELCLRFAEG